MFALNPAYTPPENTYKAHPAPPLPRSFGGLAVNKSMSKIQSQLQSLALKTVSRINGAPPKRRLLLSEWTTDLEVDEGRFATVGKQTFKCVYCGNWIRTVQELINDKMVGKKYFMDFQQKRKKKQHQSDDRLDGFDCDLFEKRFKALEKEFLKRFVLSEDIHGHVKWETHPSVANPWQVTQDIKIGSFCCESCGNRMNVWHEVRRYQGNDRLKWFSSLEWKGTIAEGQLLRVENAKLSW